MYIKKITTQHTSVQLAALPSAVLREKLQKKNNKEGIIVLD
jgi:hypothetical protein